MNQIINAETVLQGQYEVVEADMEKYSGGEPTEGPIFKDYGVLVMMQAQELYRYLKEEVKDLNLYQKVHEHLDKIGNIFPTGENIPDKLKAFKEEFEKLKKIDFEEVLPAIKKHTSEESWQEMGKLMLVYKNTV